jgi:hypothetical protein
MCTLMLHPGEMGMLESLRTRANIPGESIRRVLMYGVNSAITAAYSEARDVGVAAEYLRTEKMCRRKLAPFYDFPDCMGPNIQRMAAVGVIFF